MKKSKIEIFQKTLKLTLNNEEFVVVAQFQLCDGVFDGLHWWDFSKEKHPIVSKLYQFCSHSYKNDLTKAVNELISKCLSSDYKK